MRAGRKPGGPTATAAANPSGQRRSVIVTFNIAFRASVRSFASCVRFCEPIATKPSVPNAFNHAALVQLRTCQSADPRLETSLFRHRAQKTFNAEGEILERALTNPYTSGTKRSKVYVPQSADSGTGPSRRSANPIVRALQALWKDAYLNSLKEQRAEALAEIEWLKQRISELAGDQTGSVAWGG